MAASIPGSPGPVNFQTIPQTMLPLAGGGQPPVMTGHPIIGGGPQTSFGPASFNPLQSLFKTMFGGGQGMPNATGLGGGGDWMQRLMGIFGGQGGAAGSPFGMFGGMFGPHAGGSMFQ